MIKYETINSASLVGGFLDVAPLLHLLQHQNRGMGNSNVNYPGFGYLLALFPLLLLKANLMCIFISDKLAEVSRIPA